MSKKRLGKGLGALLPDDGPLNDENDHAQVKQLTIEHIEPNPYQPRKEFDQKLLKELSESIKEHGVIQPISVRRFGKKYQLVAGERRLRASKLANLSTIPAIEKEIDDKQLMEMALIENLQREDLNPIEEALAYKQLMEQFRLTQEEVAKRIGKNRATIANIVRLLKLPKKIQEHVSRGTFSMGHARALLSLDNDKQMFRVYQKSLDDDLTVRQLEEYIKVFKKKDAPQSIDKDKKDPFTERLEKSLTTKFGTSVRIGKRKNSRTIKIECKNNQDFQRVIEILGQ